MKLWKIILIVLGITFAILTFLMVVPVIIMDKSWWWFFAPLIFFVIVYLGIGLVILIIKVITKKSPKELKINIKDAKLRAVYDTKYDLDNPDNLKIEKTTLVRVGEKGAEKTPILVVRGKGTEMNQRRVIIINLNNPKNESTSLIDPIEPEEVDKYTRLIAEHPPEEIIEEIKTGIGQSGMPETVRKIRRQSTVEEKKKEEEEKAETANAM